MQTPQDFDSFRRFSGAVGRDPLRVQGAGGNTSLKAGGVMWVKASGTELANADRTDIFVPVDRAAALAQAQGRAGDGSCADTVLDPACTLRPSIETTFHAALDWPIVAHTHSIATLAHATSPEGLAAARDKLAGLPVAFVPYAKPGLPLTRQIMAQAQPETQMFILGNHGLIICAASVEDAGSLMDTVETRLTLPTHATTQPQGDSAPPDGYLWAAESWIARNARATTRALAGSYYPDHVVFLGPALPATAHPDPRPAILLAGQGVALRRDATQAQCAMLRCLSDLLARVPDDWDMTPIGPDAEAALLNWDAEKYRQALAART